MPGLFITATDTDVGKTIVTAGLLRHLRRAGMDAVSMKPVQTGGIPCNRGGWLAPDLAFHHRAAAMTPNDDALALMAPYVYEPACSPHLAGRLAGHYPDLDRIGSCYEALETQYGAVLVEGAGGVYAPIDETQTMRDLMQRLGLPAIVVARRGLGTINHTLLTIEALRKANLDVFGVVFNEAEPVLRDYIRVDNPATVARLSGVPVLADIDYLDDLGHDPESAWAHFDACATRLHETVWKALNP